MSPTVKQIILRSTDDRLIRINDAHGIIANSKPIQLFKDSTNLDIYQPGLSIYVAVHSNTLYQIVEWLNMHIHNPNVTEVSDWDRLFLSKMSPEEYQLFVNAAFYFNIEGIKYIIVNSRP